MVNAFKISSKTIHHEDKYSFAIVYTDIYLHVYIYETKISKTILNLVTVLFIINYEIKKSF